MLPRRINVHQPARAWADENVVAFTWCVRSWKTEFKKSRPINQLALSKQTHET
jgi:hypothetical protein